MTFRYLPQRVTPTAAAPRLDVLYRPVIPVRFHGPHGFTRVRALLDTGADESYVTEAVADDLGLVPVSRALATIHSASGPMSVWYAEIGTTLRRFHAVCHCNYPFPTTN